LINHSLKNDIDYVSIVDFNVLYGAYELYSKAVLNNLKPVIGLEIMTKDINEIYIAKNYYGYKELMKISSMINTNSELKKDEKHLIKINKEMLLPSTFLKKTDKDTLELFAKIGGKVDTLTRMQHLLNPSEISEKDNDYIKNIIDQVDIKIPILENVMPTFKIPVGINTSDFLKDLLKKSLKQYFAVTNIQNQQEYVERMIKEFNTIDEMGFNDYFLIV
jgi:DNA polymerase-3 subunit alpha